MSNPYSMFLDLLPTTNRWVGEIVGIAPGNKVEVRVVSNPSAGNIYVDSNTAFSAGDYVFIEGTTIVSAAPTLQDAVTETINVLEP